MCKKKKTIIWSIISCLVIIITGCSIYQTMKNPYKRYTHPESLQNAKELGDVARKTNALEYDVVYMPKCKDCEHAEPIFQKYLGKINKHDSLLMYNVDKPEIRKLMLSNNIHQTPTVLVQYHGKILYQYAGTNHHVLTQLLTGINPQTNQKFKLNSEFTYYQDDFDGTKSLGPVQAFQYKIHPTVANNK